MVRTNKNQDCSAATCKGSHIQGQGVQGRGGTRVMRAFLFLSLRARCMRRALPRSMLDTTSPLTSTKSLFITSFTSISRSASPADLHAVDTITYAHMHCSYRSPCQRQGVAFFHSRQTGACRSLSVILHGRLLFLATPPCRGCRPTTGMHGTPHSALSIF